MAPRTPYHTRVIDQSFYIDAHHQYRFAFGDLLCFPLQDHERTWKFDVKNDIGFYVGDEDSTKGGSLIYMPYTHKILTRGGGHRILISDVQLLQWYARRRGITRNPLPYSIVKDAVMDLMTDRDTTVIMSDKTQLLITPATEDNDALVAQPLNPAVIQHTTSVTPTPARMPTRPRTALVPIPRLRHYTGQNATAANQPSTNHTTYALSRKHSAQSWTAKTPHQPYFPPTTKTTH